MYATAGNQSGTGRRRRGGTVDRDRRRGPHVHERPQGGTARDRRGLGGNIRHEPRTVRRPDRPGSHGQDRERCRDTHCARDRCTAGRGEGRVVHRGVRERGVTSRLARARCLSSQSVTPDTAQVVQNACVRYSVSPTPCASTPVSETSPNSCGSSSPIAATSRAPVSPGFPSPSGPESVRTPNSEQSPGNTAPRSMSVAPPAPAVDFTRR